METWFNMFSFSFSFFHFLILYIFFTFSHFFIFIYLRFITLSHSLLFPIWMIIPTAFFSLVALEAYTNKPGVYVCWLVIRNQSYFHLSISHSTSKKMETWFNMFSFSFSFFHFLILYIFFTFSHFFIFIYLRFITLSHSLLFPIWMIIPTAFFSLVALEAYTNKPGVYVCWLVIRNQSYFQFGKCVHRKHFSIKNSSFNKFSLIMKEKAI